MSNMKPQLRWSYESSIGYTTTVSVRGNNVSMGVFINYRNKFLDIQISNNPHVTYTVNKILKFADGTLCCMIFFDKMINIIDP